MQKPSSTLKISMRVNSLNKFTEFLGIYQCHSTGMNFIPTSLTNSSDLI